MKYIKTHAVCFFILLLFRPWSVTADEIPHPSTYIPSLAEVEKHKAFYDDPRPYLKSFGPKQVLPPKLYSRLTNDIEKMKALWAELVGFSAPEAVGKIAPDIKPGKYTYKDLDKKSGFRELLYPDLYNRIKPGGPPHAGNIPEFEIIPTRQYYWGLPIAEATRLNLDKTKLDKNGYLIPETWTGGYPFPRPSGEFEPQQIMYNVEKRYLSFGLNFFLIFFAHGYNKDLKLDYVNTGCVRHLRFAGRAVIPPYGWYDGRAEKCREFRCYIMSALAPREVYGMAQHGLHYLDPDRADQNMIYLPSIRRIRKMSGTDTQDPVPGADLIYDDNEGWMQKLSPTRYPYRFEVLEDREYLVVAPTIDGAEYWGSPSTGLECRNVRLERRPIYVVKLTQLDPNYVYGFRIFYIDRETFNYYHIENYDQMGRLYRTTDCNYGWHPGMGSFSLFGSLILMRDHLDLHATIQQSFQIPAFWDRRDLSMKVLVEKAK